MAIGRIPPVNARIKAAAPRLDGGRGAAAQWAKTLDVSRNTVSQWLRGLITPEPEHWPAIEKRLHIASGTLARLAADHFDPRYKEVRRRAARLEREATDSTGEQQVAPATDVVRSTVQARQRRRPAG